jgi:hypothetical protein
VGPNQNAEEARRTFESILAQNGYERGGIEYPEIVNSLMAPGNPDGALTKNRLEEGSGFAQ